MAQLISVLEYLLTHCITHHILHCITNNIVHCITHTYITHCITHCMIHCITASLHTSIQCPIIICIISFDNTTNYSIDKKFEICPQISVKVNHQIKISPTILMHFKPHYRSLVMTYFNINFSMMR